MTDLEMRRAALTMAANTHEPPEMVVERAERYYAFLKSNTDPEFINLLPPQEGPLSRAYTDLENARATQAESKKALNEPMEPYKRPFDPWLDRSR